MKTLVREIEKWHSYLWYSVVQVHEKAFFKPNAIPVVKQFTVLGKWGNWFALPFAILLITVVAAITIQVHYISLWKMGTLDKGIQSS